MLETKEYVIGIVLLIVAGLVTFLLTNDGETDTLTLVLQSFVIGVVCAVGYFSGRFINARQEQKRNVKTKSKKQMKREARGE